MADKDTDAKGDAEKLDAILKHVGDSSAKMDAFGKRLDDMESSYGDGMKRLDAVCAKADADEKERKDATAKADAEKADAAKADAAKADAAKADAAKADAAKADQAKKDAEEEEKKKDAAKADADRSDSAKLREEIAALTRRLPAEVTAEVRQRMTGFQFKAEPVYQAFGDSAPAPMNGESAQDYRIRLLSKVKVHSKAYKDSDLTKIGDESAFTNIEGAIYADAMAEARSPTNVQPGVMIPQRIKDAAGREITRYHGDPNACWDQFNPPLRYVRRILVPGSAKLQ